MKLFKISTLMATCLLPTIALATTPDPAAQRDTVVEMPGGGQWVVSRHEHVHATFYFTAAGVGIDCTDDLAPCKAALEIDEADTPEGPPKEPGPPPEDPPKEEPPKEPAPEVPPSNSPTDDSVPAVSTLLGQVYCDVYIQSPGHGEVCAIVDEQVTETIGYGQFTNSEFKTTGILWICPTGRDCYFADFRSIRDKNNIIVPMAKFSRFVNY